MVQKVVCRIEDLSEKVGWYISRPVLDFETSRLLIAVNKQVTLDMAEALARRGVDVVQVTPEPIDVENIEPGKDGSMMAKKSKKKLMDSLAEITMSVRGRRKTVNMKKSLSNFVLGNVERAIIGVIESISNNPTSCVYLSMIEDEDPYLIHHGANTTYLALCLINKSPYVRMLFRDPEKGLPKFNAPGMSCDYSDYVPLGMAAMLHDIGKVFMLGTVKENKRLTDADQESWETIRKHPKLGHDVLFGKKIDSHGLLGIKYHHENFDGSGYPFGIKGYKIHLYARILRVVDSFDAATSKRPGREQKSPEEVCVEMLKLARTHYDPEICAHFVAMILGKEIPGS